MSLILKKGTIKRQAQCRMCHSKYRRKHYLANKQKYVDKARVWTRSFRDWWKDYKKQFKCSNCQENHPACIDFHHPNDDKLSTVAALIPYGNKEKIIEEIAKCIPLCRNCHAKVHWEELN